MLKDDALLSEKRLPIDYHCQSSSEAEMSDYDVKEKEVFPGKRNS